MLLIGIIITFSLLIFFGVDHYSKQIVYPKTKDIEDTYASELEKNNFDPEYLNSFTQETIYINSEHRYKLHGILYHNNNSNKFVLFCHGITMSYVGSLKYLEIFLRRGYSVLVYDHRNHGKSDRNYTSFGYFEKDDAKSWVDYLYERFEKPFVGVHGESMGASTALQLATIDHRIKFCIEDCGYSNALELFKYRSAKDNNKFVSILTSPTNLYVKFKFKWSFEDVSVEKFINKAKCPILFIHGDSDLYVPTHMVHELYDAYDGKKMIYLAKGATHANSFSSNPDEYKKSVYKFLDECET